MYTDLMIDIETLSTKENAVILSIGAIPFSLKDSLIAPEKEWLTAGFDVDLQIGFGSNISADTLRWWTQYPDNFKTALSAKDTHGLFDYMMPKLLSRMRGSFNVWANPPSFDVNILSNYCRLANQTKLLLREPTIDDAWLLNRTKCVATVKNLLGKEIISKINNKSAHDPLADCEFQIAILFEAKRLLQISD